MDPLMLLGVLAIVIGIVGVVVLIKGWKRRPQRRRHAEEAIPDRRETHGPGHGPET
jgi:hypothetical protein